MKQIALLSFIIFCFTSCDRFTNESELNENHLEVSLRSSGDLIDLLGTACVPSSIVLPGLCNDTTFLDTIDVTLVSYPGCTFTIIFQTLYCGYAGFQDVTVGDFQIVEHDCAAFSNDINNNWNQTIWSSFITDFELEVYNEIQDYLIEQNVGEGSFNCSSGAYWNINFIRASCYRYASTTQLNGYLTSVKLACGSQCCERHTRVCVQSDGTLFIDTYDTTNPWSIDCSDPAFLIQPPVWIGRPEWITNCTVSCFDD
jgi:hypothetical protein